MDASQTAQDIPLLHQRIEEFPYSIDARTRLAKAYQADGYPDLASGEAYLALLLVDEALGETGEFEDEAYEAAVLEYQEEQGERVPSSLPKTEEPDDSDDDDDDDEERDERVITWIRGPVKDGIYALLIENLIACNNLKQAGDYIKSLSSEATDEAKRLQDKLEAAVKSHYKDENAIPASEEYPEWGRVRREVYPWNNHEPDRSSQASLTSLNELLATAAPKLEARITELPDLTKPGGEGTVKQIGLFAKEDIPPGEQVLLEKSILTATARLNDTFCDACAAKLSLKGVVSEGEPISCPECYETIFCGRDCLQLALDAYHPALCGKDITSLGKDVQAKDAAHALYTLLLLRAFALAEHQDVHPLDLLQTKYLWGDFTSETPSLPFNLHFNVILPLTMLEKMEINVFSSSGRFNTWTFNTLFAKFRGTADARQGPDGKPEIGAVHPLWCLANHSCDPNVRWEWEGHMGFWTRTEAQRVHWRPDSGEGAGQGLRKDEEVLGHYCDLELGVVERREWAKGALGGDCMCERCVWEDRYPELVRKVRVER